MGRALVRFRKQNKEIAWGCLQGAKVFPLASKAATLPELLKEDILHLAQQSLSGNSLPFAGLEILSPASAPCQIICQGKNYMDHLLETGIKPENKEFNLLFTKADSTLAPPSGNLRRPAEVQLLDYEVELGLVVGREISEPVSVTEENLGDYFAGLVLANDVSARDVQVPENQWFRGKSFRGFCPVGPVFYFMEKADWAELYSLQLELRVNGEVRQRASTAQLMHRPPETLALIARTLDLRAGDLLLTGTPGGVAMQRKVRSPEEEAADLRLSGKERAERFVKAQIANGRYLKDGDKVEASIRSESGAIDLGAQKLVVVS